MGSEPAFDEEADMATAPAVTSPRTIWTLADLFERFGPIPADRIRTCPSPGLATEQDVLDVRRRERRLCELIDGVLVEKPMATYESRLAVLIGHFLEDYLEVDDLGIVLGADGMLRLAPRRILIPDVSFILWEQLPGREFPAEAIASLFPNLAVEVLSDSNTKQEIAAKLRDYFKARATLAWVVDPKARTIRVYTSARKSTLLTEKDTLDGGELLPGFRLPIRKLFARAGRWRAR
jgi:Uma2 family endonuclease